MSFARNVIATTASAITNAPAKVVRDGARKRSSGTMRPQSHAVTATRPPAHRKRKSQKPTLIAAARSPPGDRRGP